ncbi:TPA: ATP-binding protein [Pseudomonas aeruginosa]|nr:ATP-binding protein [Pseudomonas aeruginosa]MDP5707324.1 ATP-binding protein [Pseudomonas aeruginosa]HBO0353831.1 ATP-binding protein [Pseudomonas aeruginosa]HCF2189425.1 ATP-binding protein [Pseudomonas aeruginosa]HCW0995993.1 ATP-binding protein [Pseudomonas aeruginosa]HCW1002608.1 ATP-binding protein [Pseudomonas aeruginosa]
MDYKDSPLWKSAFSPENIEYKKQSSLLEAAYDAFRERVSLLVSQISKDMPNLTVHDITHIDALWWTASEVSGIKYEINPAEAFVLGGAFLLHDSAHCVAAYPGGIEEIMNLPEWELFLPKENGSPIHALPGTLEFQTTLFEVLRCMHPKQAKNLPRAKWKAPHDTTELYLIPNDDLREAYGDAIGQIAESHWFYPQELEIFNKKVINPPAAIHPAPWKVDLLKIAILLRTADAAHINSQRAPKFLFALTKPSASSTPHWQFQGRIHDIKLSDNEDRHELIVSGTEFPVHEQEAWWLAYDTAKMIDKELRAADVILAEFHRPRLSARSVAYINTPTDFAINVPTKDWHPVDTSIKITNITTIVENFGGSRLYGNSPAQALRELIQNSADAIRACRALEGLSEEEGEIEVTLSKKDEKTLLTVTDTGVGMSKYVLTEVLLDFGRSLWKSPEIRREWEELAKTKFQPTGKFGIGFFSIFMLGKNPKVVTHRYDNKNSESRDWVLEFTNGTKSRPILRPPTNAEKLKRHGTKIIIELNSGVLEELLPKTSYQKNSSNLTLRQLCEKLAPALDINLYTKTESSPRELAVHANDWKSIDVSNLLNRTNVIISPKSTLELTDIIDGNEIKARACIYNPKEFSPYLSSTGVGVTNGIKAADIAGFLGVMKSKPQEDLARRTAIPDITAQQLASWAEIQKNIAFKNNTLTAAGSALLIHFGASESNLIIGKLGGRRITVDQLTHEAAKLSEIIISDDEITHDDDDISKSDFENWFEQESNLLELSGVSKPDWLRLIDGYDEKAFKTNYQIAIDAIEKAWGAENYTSQDRDLTVVGDANGSSVSRYCDILSRTSI